MNEAIHYIYFFYFISNGVRDALEYITNKPEYSLDAYNAKKSTVKMALNENTPFNLFCKNNGEQGEKLKNEYKDFYETVYGDNSQFVKVIDNKVVVDHTLNSKVLKMTILLKVSLYNVLQLHLKNPDNAAHMEKEFTDLIDYEERYFEVIAGMISIDYALRDRFLAFNKAKRESQGNDTVESNFIQSELNDALGLFNLLKKVAEENSHKEFIGLTVYASRGIDLITGKEKPKENNKLDDEFKEIWGHYQMIVSQMEPEYKKMHIKIWEQIQAFEKEKIAKSKN